MWNFQETGIVGHQRFFLISLSHDNLENFYRTNFAMSKFHGYSLTELEEMIPWERDVYVGLVSQWVEEENERLKQQKNRDPM